MENEQEEIYETIARFRKTFPGVKKERYNSFTQSYYASFDDVWNAVEPHMQKVGIYEESYVSDGKLFVTLYNKAGKARGSNVTLPDSTDQFQKFGSALTYYHRYLICLMLKVTEFAEDDDGNSGEPPREQAIDDGQLGSITDLIEATGTERSRLLEYIEGTYGCKRIEDLNYKQAAIIRRMLLARYERQRNGSD